MHVRARARAALPRWRRGRDQVRARRGARPVVTGGFDLLELYILTHMIDINTLPLPMYFSLLFTVAPLVLSSGAIGTATGRVSIDVDLSNVTHVVNQ